MRRQVQNEFSAAMQYLLMSAHFARDDISLDGVAKLFSEHADEEREHGKKLLEYLQMRGDAETSASGLSFSPMLDKRTWADAEEALRDALDMEKKVSGSIKKLVDVCENFNAPDYHAADWLAGQWLEEQLKGQRKLAGLINSLNTFRRDHEELADWMFSNQLLHEE